MVSTKRAKMGLMSSSKFGWAITGRVGAKFEAGLFVSFHQGLDFGLRHELTVCAGLILISESPFGKSTWANESICTLSPGARRNDTGTAPPVRS